MAIRLRTVGDVRVALCAVESDPMPGDVYLDDGDHYALAAKFRRDWHGQANDFSYPEEWAAMDTQKVRDAATEAAKWQEGQMAPDEDMLGIPKFLQQQATQGEGTVSLETDAEREARIAQMQESAAGTIGGVSLDELKRKERAAILGTNKPPIKGYRSLTQLEIDQINTSKDIADNVGAFIAGVEHSATPADPRWIAIAKTDLQRGFMALTRAIARPDGF